MDLPILFLLYITPVFSSYVLVTEPLNWTDARDYCKRNYTELAEINNEQQRLLALTATDGYWLEKVWIGLQRNSSNSNIWVWSSGKPVSQSFWTPYQPDMVKEQNGAMLKGRWYHECSENVFPFLCTADSSKARESTRGDGTITNATTTENTTASYVLVTAPLNWTHARDYCRKNYTKLAEINNEQELDLALNAIGNKSEKVWIGLQRNSTNSNIWFWSSGKPVSRPFWAANQSDLGMEQNGAMFKGEWYYECSENVYPFLCTMAGSDTGGSTGGDGTTTKVTTTEGTTTKPTTIHEILTNADTTEEIMTNAATTEETTTKPTTMEKTVTDVSTTMEPVEKKTWKEAFDYCKKTGKNLARPKGQEDLQQIGQELSQKNPLEPIWVGLHFFAGQWLWMDGLRADPGLLPRCPALGMDCGALLVEVVPRTNTFEYNLTDKHCNATFQFICN